MNSGLQNINIITYGGCDSKSGSDSRWPDDTRSHHRVLCRREAKRSMWVLATKLRVVS